MVKIFGKERSRMDVIDFLSFIPFFVAVIYSIFFYNKYELVIVYFSCIFWISYWMIRLIFSPNYMKNADREKDGLKVLEKLMPPTSK